MLLNEWRKCLIIYIRKRELSFYISGQKHINSLTEEYVFIFQGKFSATPSVFVTAKHHNSGLKRDAASVWIEDVEPSSCKICLRELQNYAGSHQEISVVSIIETLFPLPFI